MISAKTELKTTSHWSPFGVFAEPSSEGGSRQGLWSRHVSPEPSCSRNPSVQLGGLSRPPLSPSLCFQSPESLSIIGVRSVSILHAHMDGNHGTRVSEPQCASTDVQHLACIWAPQMLFFSRSRLLQPSCLQFLSSSWKHFFFCGSKLLRNSEEKKKKTFSFQTGYPWWLSRYRISLQCRRHRRHEFGP